MATSLQIMSGMRGFGPAEISRAANLCRPVPMVAPTDTNATVRELFDQHRELISLPVVDGTRALGLIKRHTFQSEMAKPFRQELHEHKSCIAFMDGQPLIIEADTSIERAAILVADSRTNALADGFLVVRGNEFLGIGFGLRSGFLLLGGGSRHPRFGGLGGSRSFGGSGRRRLSGG